MKRVLSNPILPSPKRAKLRCTLCTNHGHTKRNCPSLKNLSDAEISIRSKSNARLFKNEGAKKKRQAIGATWNCCTLCDSSTHDIRNCPDVKVLSASEIERRRKQHNYRKHNLISQKKKEEEILEKLRNEATLSIGMDDIPKHDALQRKPQS